MNDLTYRMAERAMEADIERILIRHDDIQRRVREMAEEIVRAYGEDATGITIVPILSGSIIFLADLIRDLPYKIKVALIHVSTYAGTTPGEPKIVRELAGDIEGRHVLLIDDILDSGRTLRRVQEEISVRKPASLKTAVLLRKPDRAPPDAKVDFVGFDIEDAFVVGYGLDFSDYYRNYPHIGVLREECAR
ncbi:MAG: hypoxanthine phosphoribosyltransferase [Phycisphaerales bacterium]|nr:hypoxanthine phosphoribosyltransferase [Phycisphaerales bacterium]